MSSSNLIYPSSDELAARLLKEEDVLVIPGSKFDWSSICGSAHLTEGLNRFNRLVGDIGT